MSIKKKGKPGKLVKSVTGLTKFYDPERDGVTFSLLSTWRDCREKARLHLQGWTPKKGSMAIIFGAVVHAVLEIVYGQIRAGTLTEIPGTKHVDTIVAGIAKEWHKENPRADEDTLQDLELTLLLTVAIMPLYFKMWYSDFTKLKWEALEATFRVPIKVQSFVTGKMMKTFLRGKIDGVFKRLGKSAEILLETKSKGRIDTGTLSDMLPFELQVNIYMTVKRMLTGKNPNGVMYNIIRRPQLRQKKNETLPQFAARVVNDIKIRPEFYFIRMELVVDQQDLDREQGEIEDLIADFLDWWYSRTGHYKNSGHCENKYGTCPMLPICGQKNYDHHFKRETVFRELEDI